MDAPSYPLLLLLLLQVQELARDFCKKDMIKIQVGDAELQANPNIEQARLSPVSCLLFVFPVCVSCLLCCCRCCCLLSSLPLRTVAFVALVISVAAAGAAAC